MATTITVSSILRTIVRKRKFIAAATLLAAAVSAGISFILPVWYKATGSILPPEAGSTASAITAQLLLAGFQPGMIPSAVSPSDLYAAILRSETVMYAVIDSLNLVEAYKTKNRYKAFSRLWKRTEIDVGFDGVVRVSYEDKDRERSALVVNQFLMELDSFNKNVRVGNAAKLRQFVEKRVHETSQELKEAEDELRRFQEQTGVVFISEQAKASIETAAEIFVRIAELEVEMERLRTSTTEANPEIANIRSQIRALEKKLGEMGYSGTPLVSEDDYQVFPKFRSAAEVQQRLAELSREVEIKSRVLGFLRQQYEEARIEEVRDTPTIQILDWARVPSVRSRPKRKAIVIVSSLIALLLSSGLTVRKEAKSPVDGSVALWDEISGAVKGDLRNLLKIVRRK